MTRSRWLPLIGCALTLVLSAGPVLAQAQEKKGEGRRAGFASSMAGMSFETTKLGLLRMEQVQNELKLTQEQKDKVAELRRSIGEQTRGERGDRNATPEERKKRFAEAREKGKKVNAEAEKKLDGILKEDQLKRLNEIYIQQRGVQGLKDEAVSKALKLNEEQIAKIDAAIKWGEEERTKLRADSGEKGRARDPQARAEMMEKQQKVQKEVETKALAALTDSQKADYEKMKGSPFKLERGAFQGPGAGGQRGGRREQGEGQSKEKA